MYMGQKPKNLNKDIDWLTGWLFVDVSNPIFTENVKKKGK